MKLIKDPENILFTGIAAMAIVSLMAGIFLVTTWPAASTGEGYTAMYMNTSDIDRNITRNSTDITIPFYVENREGQGYDYRYSVDVHFKHSEPVRQGTDYLTEDWNVDDKYNVASGHIWLENGATEKVECIVPVQSDKKWKYANLTIWLYKGDSTDPYRSLRFWAMNQA